MDITAPVVLKPDVLLIPVTQLDERMRQGIDCADGDVAISRPQSRHTSTVVDSEAAALIEQFRKPRPIVEAVVLFSKARGLEADTILDDAYRLVRRMVEQGFMLAPGEDQPADMDGIRPSLSRGEDFEGARILRLLHLVEDTELYLVRDPEHGPAVLKLQRGEFAMEAQLRREAELLRCIGGGVAPALLRARTAGERPHLLLEYCRGVDGEAAAIERRAGAGDPSARLLALLQRTARAYAALHTRGVLHGDVHPRNLLVDGDDAVRLVDFGLGDLANSPSDDESPAATARALSLSRGGIAFFYEPEVARAALDGVPSPPATPAGEQYAVGALLYYLLAGTHYLDFSLGRLDLMRDIAEKAPIPLAQRNLPDWPALEACLFRALSKDPRGRYESMAAFAGALERVEPPRSETRSVAIGARAESAALAEAAAGVLRETALDASWFTRGMSPGPTASLNYGAAGVAYVLQRAARAKQDPALLARADAWACRAAALAQRDPDAFVNPGGEISPQTVGTSSPFHTRSGVAAVEALVARSACDEVTYARALDAFLSCARQDVAGLDLTLGQASRILGAAVLLPTAGGHRRQALYDAGNEWLRRLWSALDEKPSIATSDVDNLGMAHGWAGFLYATLLWCSVAGAPIPATAAGRVRQLADLAEPSGRGLIWPWTVSGDGSYMPGWCNGSAGYVHLWTIVDRMLHEDGARDLAIGAAWSAWDAPDAAGTLCCGLIGRAYALLNLYRHTGDAAWLARARELGERAAAFGEYEADYPHSLYKGRLALVALASDLDDPRRASQPFFEPEPW